MLRRVTCFTLWISVLALARAEPIVPARPHPAIEHVVVISIDGCRPDVLLLADTPNLHRLAHQGAYTFWAWTTAVSVTLPSHTSMVTGLTPQRHGITWNRLLPLSEPIYPAGPTMMELATKAGYVTAMIAGKSKFVVLNKPGTITHAYVPAEKETCNDTVVAVRAVRMIEVYKPALTFIHFPELDGVGHAKGWGSREQREHLRETDAHVGEVLAALDSAGIAGSTFVIVTADHGGTALSHGAEDPRSRYIPWIAWGPGVRRDFDLTRLPGLEVHTEDTFATVCYLLGLPIDAKIDGKPVSAVFEAAQ
jgi:predicted AlkP superfamily pyrophosphatase or phosphodiesterase